MNPFKHKQLEEFTIEDCEFYISRYPDGEHTIEVKRLLKKLKKHKEKPPMGANEKGNPQPKKTRKTKSKTKKSSNRDLKQTKETNSSKDVAETIFFVVGIIVVVIVVGTIIIMILNEILPYNWWNKYKYTIFLVGIVFTLVAKKFNW